jgi:hypothetical protein
MLLTIANIWQGLGPTIISYALYAGSWNTWFDYYYIRKRASMSVPRRISFIYKFFFSAALQGFSHLARWSRSTKYPSIWGVLFSFHLSILLSHANCNISALNISLSRLPRL